MKLLLMYVILSAALLILVTVYSLYFAELQFISDLSFYRQFEVYGRYNDPITPLIFIFGFISLSLLLDKVKTPGKLFFQIVLCLTLGIILLFEMTFPFILYNQYLVGNNFGIWYLVNMSNIFPIGILIGVLFIVITLLFIFGFFSNKMKYFFILTILLLSIFICSVAILNEISISDYRNSQSYMGRYISENSPEKSVTVIDSNSDGNFDYVWITLFLTKGTSQIMPVFNESSLSALQKNHTINYIISSKSLNYSLVDLPLATSNGGYKIYRISNESSNFSSMKINAADSDKK